MTLKTTLALLAFLFLFLNTKNTSAQTTYHEFAPVGATWKYLQKTGGIFGYAEYSTKTLVSLNNDTVLGQPCKDLGDFYAYRDSLKMYIYRKGIDASWKLFLDFGWQAGDTVTIPTIGLFFGPDSLLNVPVDSSSLTVFNGDTIPMLRFNLGYTSIYAFLNYGFINDYFLPQNPYPLNFTDMDWYLNLRCYQDTVVGLIKMPGVGGCDTSHRVGINEIQKQIASFQLYPNPCNNEILLQLTTPGAKATSVTVYNTFGQKVCEKAFSENDLSINTVAWAGGFYHYTIMNKDGALQKGSFIVSH